jgi:hypothetical protein
VSATRAVTVGAELDYVVLETKVFSFCRCSEGSGSECNSGGDCRRWVSFCYEFDPFDLRSFLSVSFSYAAG